MYAVIRNPLCNTCRIAELLNSEQYRPGLHDVSNFVENFSALTDLSAYRHIFCPALQFKTWYELLDGAVEETVEQKQFMESEELST